MKFIIILSLLALTLSAPLAEAKSREGHDGLFEGKALDQSLHQSLSADDAANAASARHGGRVLSVRPTSEGGRSHYEVKMLSRGEVWMERVYPEN